MIITTCVVELIEEDIEGIIHSLNDEVNTRLMVVKTEHFKCNSHLPGMIKTQGKMSELMTKKETVLKRVNILGFKYDKVEKTELYHQLEKRGVEVYLTIPTKVNIGTIAEATDALKNKRFIYGNTPFDSFSFCDFMIDLGMEPIIIQCREVLDDHKPIMLNIIEKEVLLSGGQRQRLSIARLFLKDASIIILDEATSSLYNQTERELKKTLDRLQKGKTSITIAHRLTTVEKCDRILVLDEGRIVEEGSHDYLKNNNGIYSDLLEE